MYFSHAKRKMLSRVLTALAFCFIALLLLFGLSGFNINFCDQRLFTSIPMLCPQTDANDWNLFYHLGGNGPWIPRASAGDESLPFDCVVDQAHMISRHAERYPTTNAGNRHLALLKRLRNAEKHLTGSLAFVKDWTYFTNTTGRSFEDLVHTGPYAGTTQSFETGLKLRNRYSSLVKADRTTKFWTCEAGRDIETAHYFANGFFGSNWNNGSAELVIVPETAKRGADTLTPGDTCLAYIDDPTEGHDRGYAELAAWQGVFTRTIAARLEKEGGNLKFTPLEIYGMMEMCGFEILAKGSSPWCKIFTHDEWLDFEYGRDLLHYYRAGPGNKYSSAMGMVWLHATTKLLSNPKASGFYASFVHDGDIIPLISVLEILQKAKKAEKLPNDQRLDSRMWKTSDVVPMGGRLIFERVTCSNTGLGQNLQRSYVRLFINDGLFDLQKGYASGGLPYAAGMKEWTNMVSSKSEEIGSYKKICNLPASAPGQISFLQPQYD